MSDTVKLIIEIPKDIYDGLINNRGVVIPNYWHEYVADLCKNGTLLDDVKAEIDYERNRYLNLVGDGGYCNGLNKALKIINNIGKAESEGKECKSE